MEDLRERDREGREERNEPIVGDGMDAVLGSYELLIYTFGITIKGNII
jgi:hypothetical protein